MSVVECHTRWVTECRCGVYTVSRESAVGLSPQRNSPHRAESEGISLSTLQKPVPEWTGHHMQVPCPNLLSDAWDASESFAEAFVSVYHRLTAGYDAAVAEGRLRHDGEVVTDGGTEISDLQKALLAGEGRYGSVELSRRYGVCRQTVARVAGEMGVVLERAKGTARQIAEAHFRDGETRPRVILAAIAIAAPDAEPPKRNTITVWRKRWENSNG